MKLSKRLLIFFRAHSILGVLLLVVFFAALINTNFLTPANLSNVSRQIAVTTILAMGATVLIICGLIDLSCGSVLALSGVLSISAYQASESMLLAFAVAIAVAVSANLINAAMVTIYRVPPFIATLAMLAVARGGALLYTNGQNIYRLGAYTQIGQGSILHLPIPVIFLVLLSLATWYLLQHTRLGRELFAIGGNEEAALASGIQVKRTKVLAYVINGVLVGTAAVLFMSRVNAGLPNGAISYELHALTATIIGGTSFSGGIGTAGGTVAGAFIVGFLNNIMNLANVNSYLQEIIRGSIIALAVTLDMRAKGRREKRARYITREEGTKEKVQVSVEADKSLL